MGTEKWKDRCKRLERVARLLALFWVDAQMQLGERAVYVQLNEEKAAGIVETLLELKAQLAKMEYKTPVPKPLLRELDKIIKQYERQKQ